MNNRIKLRELLKHSAGLRQHGLTVRLVLVVLGRVEGAGYMVPIMHFDH